MMPGTQYTDVLIGPPATWVVPAAAEHRREDHQEKHRQGQGEELPLAVADKGAQVVAGQVQGHPDHR
jgi:hypothetical protein